MRSLNKGWIGITLVILFGASLFFFRGSSRYSNLFNSDNFVANVSGTQISTTQFARSLEMNIGQFAQMIGEELSGDQIRAFQIHQLVLQNLINKAVFENEFDNLNFILDDTTIAEQTKKRFPNLYANNKINDDALNSFLRQQRLKIEDLVNIINYETRAVIFDNLLFEKNFPSELSKKISLINSQSRKVSLIKVPYDKLIVPNFDENKITKNNDELINFFNENSINYKSAEKRDISYLVIDKNFFKENFIPNSNEISNYFENNKDIYVIPEKRSFKQFNFKTKEEAQNFKIKISGLSYDEIQNYILDKDIKFNEFEDVDSNQVLDELSNVIFSISENEVSDVITTTLAFHVIILEQITKQKDPILEEVNEKIKETLTNVQLDNFYNDLKSKINQEILNGNSINEIASENKLVIKKFSNISQNEKDLSDLEQVVVNTSFNQNKEFLSDIFEFDLNTSFIIYVDNIYPSVVKNITDVFDNVLLDFHKFKKLEYADKIYQENNGNDLSQINKIFNLDISELNINIGSDIIPATLVRNILETDLNNITFFSDEDNIYYAEINDINIPDTSNNFENIELLPDFKNAFGSEIIKTKNISINEELIKGLLSQYK